MCTQHTDLTCLFAAWSYWRIGSWCSSMSLSWLRQSQQDLLSAASAPYQKDLLSEDSKWGRTEQLDTEGGMLISSCRGINWQHILIKAQDIARGHMMQSPCWADFPRSAQGLVGKAAGNLSPATLNSTMERRWNLNAIHFEKYVSHTYGHPLRSPSVFFLTLTVLLYPLVLTSGVTPEAAMYVLPMVLILVIHRNWGSSRSCAHRERKGHPTLSLL